MSSSPGEESVPRVDAPGRSSRFSGAGPVDPGRGPLSTGPVSRRPAPPPAASASRPSAVASTGHLPPPGAAGPDPPTTAGAVPDPVSAAPVSAPESADRGLAYSMRAFRHRDFTLFWVGALISNSGTWLQNVTVPFVLYELTHNALWVGLATFAQFLPGVLFGPTGGSLADRHDRRRLLVVTQLMLAVAALLLWATWSSGLRSPVVILVLVAVSGTLNGLNSPSWQAFVPELVPRDDLLSAITLNSLQFNAARALGPTIAGLVLATLGPGPAFLLNALSFGCVLGALVVMRRPPSPVRREMAERGVLRQFRGAIRYIHTQPGLEISVVIAGLVAFLGAPIVQFTVVYTTDVYHVGKVAFGVLSAAMGIGAAGAAPLISGWDAVLRRATIVRYGLPLYGLACVAFGLSGSMLVGFLSLLVAGAGFLAVVSATNTSMQVIVSDVFRGRVMAARVMCYTLCYSVGGLVQGWLAEHLGLRLTVTGMAVILTATAGCLAVRPQRLVPLDDPPDQAWAAG